MKKRLLILLGIFLGFLGLLVALPSAPTMKPSRLAKNLPETFGKWVGNPREPGEAEKQKLAADTEFERMEYVDPLGILPPVEVSIVFSGKNLSQSIHQPEVCLRAQGWQFIKENHFFFEGVLPGGKDLPVKEIICRQQQRKLVEGTGEEEGEDPEFEPVFLENGEPSYIWRSFYYTFFGHTDVTSGHYSRTFLDMKDRVMKGYDQRWAYATFSSLITKKYADQGYSIGGLQSLDEEGIKAHIKTFLKELLPLVVSEPGEGKDPSLEEGKNLGS